MRKSNGSISGVVFNFLFVTFDSCKKLHERKKIKGLSIRIFAYKLLLFSNHACIITQLGAHDS